MKKLYRWVFLAVAILLVGMYVSKRISNIRANKPRIVHHENQRLRNDAYSRHVGASMEISNGEVFENLKAVEKAAKKDGVEKVKAGRGYKIDKLTHSVFYLNPMAVSVLEDIGHEFNRRTAGKHFYTVTSLLRTIDQQNRLTKTNRNASPNVSTHSYGTSFDISYYRFDGIKQQNERLQKVLEEVLADFQEEKRIFSLKERKSTCYHVTVRPE